MTTMLPRTQTTGSHAASQSYGMHARTLIVASSQHTAHAGGVTHAKEPHAAVLRPKTIRNNNTCFFIGHLLVLPFLLHFDRPFPDRPLSAESCGLDHVPLVPVPTLEDGGLRAIRPRRRRPPVHGPHLNPVVGCPDAERWSIVATTYSVSSFSRTCWRIRSASSDAWGPARSRTVPDGAAMDHFSIRSRS